MLSSALSDVPNKKNVKQYTAIGSKQFKIAILLAPILLSEYMNTASAIPIPKRPLIINFVYSSLVKVRFNKGIFNSDSVITKQASAIVFFKALTKNGDIF